MPESGWARVDEVQDRKLVLSNLVVASVDVLVEAVAGEIPVATPHHAEWLEEGADVADRPRAREHSLQADDTQARLASIARAYSPVTAELDVALPVSTGAFPDELRGVLYRNGAGSLEMGRDKYMHPFDGDGMISRFSFDAGEVHYKNRFVQTRERKAELREGRMLYRSFGTRLPGGFRNNLLRMRFKNAANTSVVWHGGRLLALWEGGLPHAIEPTTLATLSRFDFDGQLRPHRWSLLTRLITPEFPFSAHPRICPDTGDLYNFGTLIGADPKLVIYRVDPRGVMRERRFIPLPGGLPFVHDFVLTQKHLVFVLPPVKFGVAKTLLGLASPIEAIGSDPDARTRILVVPRNGSAPIWLETQPGFVFHFVNGYESSDHEIVLHGARMPTFRGEQIDMRDVASLTKASSLDALLTRYTLSLKSRSVQEEQLSNDPMELPTHDLRFTGKPHRYAWAIAREAGSRAPFHETIAKIDLHSGRLTHAYVAPDLPGEPVFVARSDDAEEGDGWLLAVTYAAEANVSELVCLDAQSLDVIAKAVLPHAVPPGFHGRFVRHQGQP